MEQLHGLDPITVMDALIESADRVAGGSTEEIEQMLLLQAKTLEVFFNDSFYLE